MVNTIIYNYKFHVEGVLNGETAKGLLDMGLRLYFSRAIQLAGIPLPDPKSIPSGKTDEARLRAKEERKKAVVTLDKAKTVLCRLLLKDASSEVGEDLGRTIVVSPRKPNRYARAFFSAFVPCNKEILDFPYLTSRCAGYRFVDVTKFMQLASESDFDETQAMNFIESLECYDFDK